jgi:hypothetical protein
MDKIKEADISKNELLLEKGDLPIFIVYKEKRYVLILTKNDKLILNKHENQTNKGGLIL